MDNKKVDTSEPEELSSLESNTGGAETDSEYATGNEDSVAASNSIPQATGSSLLQELSEEEVEKVMQSVISHLDIMQMSLEENQPLAAGRNLSDDAETDSEYATCSEGGAAASSGKLSQREVKQVMEEVISSIDSIPQLKLKELHERLIPESDFLAQPVRHFDTTGGKPKSSKSIHKFLRSRLKYLAKLVEQLQKLKKFMDDVTINVARAEQPDPDDDTLVAISSNWSSIFDRWEAVRAHLGEAISKTKKILKEEGKDWNITDLELYIDCLSLLHLSLHELSVMCYNSLEKYRAMCDLFVDYEFMVHINVLPAQADELLHRLPVELEEFGVYYRSPEPEDD